MRQDMMYTTLVTCSLVLLLANNEGVLSSTVSQYFHGILSLSSCKEEKTTTQG